MEKRFSPTSQLLILLGAFMIGVAFRLIRLGVLPLNNMEAGIALQALAAAKRGETLFGDHIAYVGWTGITFFLFSTGNFIARFWPAFSGALVVFIPYLFRKQIGEWMAALASIVLAISPEMVGLSRIVGSPMMAMVFLLLAVGFLFKKKPILMGLCLALGLMSGPGFWVGVLILGISFAFSNTFFGWGGAFDSQLLKQDKPFWIPFLFSFVITLLVVGTGFFMVPAALSGIFSGLYTFIIRFGGPRLTPYWFIPFALLAYATGALIFGLWGGIRGILVRSKFDLFLFSWALFGLVFLILYPGGSPADIIWVTMPLWILGVRVTFFAWPKPGSINLVVIITAVSVVVISAFMLLAMRALVTPTLTQSQQLNYFIALMGGAVLLVAVTLLVNFGWSESIARTGLLLGLALVFTAGMIAVSVNATGIGPDVPYELWAPDEPVLLTEWLQVTIDRVLVWNARRSDPVDINVSGIESPGMRWALRDYDRTDFVPFLPAQTQPGILITEMGVFPEISNSYQGQGLVWMREVPWQDLSPSQYLTWLITRDVPTISTQLILWVRTDLMPSGQFVE
jgi:hypothetical protein